MWKRITEFFSGRHARDFKLLEARARAVVAQNNWLRREHARRRAGGSARSSPR